MQKIEVEILGLSTSPASNGYALILQEKSGARRLPIMIEAAQAQAIALEMESIKSGRPMTHDLMKAVIETLGATLVEVVINDIQDSTFFARLVLDTSEEGVDARPSDAIALAVRFSAPIYVAAEVMDEASFEAEGAEESEHEDDDESESYAAATGTESSSGKVVQSPSRLEILAQELQKAIEKEEYETAAIIRDEIKKLGGSAD